MVEHKRSEDQEAAWKAFTRWMAIGRGQEFRLGGLAGTGKTTMVKAIRESMNNCEVITPTAKAAEVLNRKGVPAKTSHALFCRFEHETTDEKGRVQPVFSDKKHDVQFLIVDESSMITSEMRARILRYSNRVVWVGDYGQLPPVDPDGDGSRVMDEDSLDAKLTEVHRTDDMNILEFALFLRGGGNPKKYVSTSDSVRVDPPGIDGGPQIVDYVLRHNIWPVICYTNRFIDGFNLAIRKAMQITKEIEPGLKIVCTKNNRNYQIANGQMFTVRRIVRDNRIETECGLKFPVSFEKQDWNSVTIADGYAVTCHKAQGSEWPKIAVCEDRKTSPQWRYTAATRVQKSLTFFTND